MRLDEADAMIAEAEAAVLGMSRATDVVGHASYLASCKAVVPPPRRHDC